MNRPLIVAAAVSTLVLPQFNNADAAVPYDGANGPVRRQ